MEMELVTLIGLSAGTLTTAAFVPQVVQAWKTRSTGDISLLMFSAMVTGIMLWVIYGVLTGDLPVILANGAAFLLAGSILVAKLKFK